MTFLQLQSCNPEILQRGEVIEALTDAIAAGKTRFIGYRGNNEEARWAVDGGLFDTVKRPIANGV